ncbi:MAG TPA: 2-phospho-L-lactate guanylyltransferase [Chloroflexota bacterium]|nr:2-phospho-L-lactate guanylyltransferase [Chloroflexota bacterium]
MIAAIVPFKAPPEGKSRLREVLDDAERRRLALDVLRHVVSTLERAEPIDAVFVLARADPGVGRRLLDTGRTLNQGLRQALAWVGDQGFAAALVAPADLPHLSPADVERLLAALPPASGGVVAPAKDGGTGGLALRPATLIQPAFGRRSADRHLALIRAAGGSAVAIDSRGWATDLDTPADLELLRRSHQLTDFALIAGSRD